MDVKEIYLYRMIHLENIPHILLNGITHKNSQYANPNYISIGDDSIISTRRNVTLPNGKTIGDHIPFYFGPRMPMLFVIQHGKNGVKQTNAKDIVYCITNVDLIQRHNLDFVFTDGHANAYISTFHNPNEIANFDVIVDIDAVRSHYWRDDKDLDKKRRKEAEFLVYGDVPASAIGRFVVYDEDSKSKLIGFGVVGNMVDVKPQYYF